MTTTELITVIVVAMLVVAGVGIAGYFILRAIFIRMAEGMTRHIAQGLDQAARAAVSTRAGQAAILAAERFAAGQMTHLDAYAAAEHMSPESARREFSQSIEKIARIMDGAVKLPIIGPVGLDALLGLFPVVGDATSTAVSLTLIAKSLRYGIPRELVVKMLANVLFDLLLGLIPVAGDLADMWYRSNTRNVLLLRQYLEDRVDAPPPARV